MKTNSTVSNIKTFIRMDDYFVDNILPHVNVSIAGKGHWIYCCITPKAMEIPVVKQWADAQDSSAFAQTFLDDNSWAFIDDKSENKLRNPYFVVGMSLSQLTYRQLCVLDKEGCHSVVKLPSNRLIPTMAPTKNPLLHRNPEKPKYIYFARNREVDATLKVASV